LFYLNFFEPKEEPKSVETMDVDLDEVSEEVIMTDKETFNAKEKETVLIINNSKTVPVAVVETALNKVLDQGNDDTLQCAAVLSKGVEISGKLLY